VGYGKYPPFFMEYNNVDKFKEIARPLLEKKGIELVEILYRKEGNQMVLRLLVDRKGGITLDECAALNEELGIALDQDETMDTSYILEVSSPGVDRPLRSKGDFERAIGKRIEVALKEQLSGKLGYTGRLAEVKEDSIILKKNEIEAVNIPLSNINNARVEVEFRRE